MRGAVPAAAVILALVAAQAAPSDSHGLSVSLNMTGSAEMGASFDLALAVDNTGSSAVSDGTVDLTLSAGTQLVGTQGDLTCAGTQTVHCTLAPIAAAASKDYALTLRSDTPGLASVSATATAGGSSATTASTVTIYTLQLRDLAASAAVAGEPFVASQTLVRSDTGAPVAPRSVDCRGAVAGHSNILGKPVRHGSRLTCTWRVPAGTSGKYFRGMIVASTHRGGMQTKQPFLRKIR